MEENAWFEVAAGSPAARIIEEFQAYSEQFVAWARELHAQLELPEPIKTYYGNKYIYAIEVPQAWRGKKLPYEWVGMTKARDINMMRLCSVRPNDAKKAVFEEMRVPNASLLSERLIGTSLWHISKDHLYEGIAWQKIGEHSLLSGPADLPHDKMILVERLEYVGRVRPSEVMRWKEEVEEDAVLAADVHE